ncbi:MAG TPA: ADP-ribosylation factor-like protein [Candidatus Deferrimicrobiaceae bacterium]
MALFNYATRELSAKIVYYGPGLSGKTTNIEMVHKLLRPDQKGKLISLPTETDRTLFFDFLPIELGQIKGFKVRFHLYTVPGQVFYNATRRLVLQGVDGVVFVADSQRGMEGSNEESLRNLIENLSSYGKKIEELPFVIQYNKRDLKNVATVDEMNAYLNPRGVPVQEASAISGPGVTETLVAVSRLVFNHLRKTLLMPGDEQGTEELGQAGRERIDETFGGLEATPPAADGKTGGDAIEEIGNLEEIVEEPPVDESLPMPGYESFPEEVELEYTAHAPVGNAETVPPEPMFDELEEIEIETVESRDEGLSYRSPTGAAVSVEAEGGGLSFLKFETPMVDDDGYAVLPALFLDKVGNSVRIRIKLGIEGES